MKQTKTKEWINILLIIILIIVISFSVTSIYYSRAERDDGIIEISKLDKNMGYAMCVDSINSKEFLAKNEAIPLFNLTQKNINDLIEKYPEGKIINSEHCLNYVVIYQK